MKLTELVISEDPSIGAYIKDFNPNDVILDNYFYYKNGNLFADFEYTDREIGLILNLTDGEYAELVNKFFSNASQNTDIEKEEIELRNRIEELEKKLSASRDYEEAQKKKAVIESELRKINADLSIYQEFERKYDEAEKEFQQFQHLGKYNLNKIHSDITQIESDIQKLEQQLLHSKKEYREYNMSRTEYDKGKIGLAIFWTIAVMLIAGALYILKLPIYIISIGAGAGFLISFLLIFTARSEIDYPVEVPDGTVDNDSLQGEISNLKTKRHQILDLIGAHSAEEFFHVKAQYQAYLKKYEYIKAQKENVLNNTVDYKSLVDARDKTQSEYERIQSILTDTENLLPPDQYLTIRREVDNLRLRQNQILKNDKLDKEGISAKLAQIRKELNEKIPEYINILQQTLVSSFDNISAGIDDVCSKIGSAQVSIAKDGSNFETLPSFHKMLLQFILIREIYKENFAFIIQPTQEWREEDVANMNKLIELTDERETKFYLLK